MAGILGVLVKEEENDLVTVREIRNLASETIRWRH
jgi:hypothetical protein